jgi:hypothetical protein
MFVVFYAAYLYICVLMTCLYDTRIHGIYVYMYRAIHKSLRDFRPLRYSSRDGHAEGEHVSRGRDISSFCPTLQVLGTSALGDAADGNPGGTYELNCMYVNVAMLYVRHTM